MHPRTDEVHVKVMGIPASVQVHYVCDGEYVEILSVALVEFGGMMGAKPVEFNFDQLSNEEQLTLEHECFDAWNEAQHGDVE